MSARRSPLRLLAMLVACGLVLGGSPVGHAGHLWMHLATVRHEPAPTPVHDRHAALSPMVEAMEREALALVGHGLHEHDGVAHTHDEAPTEDPVVVSGLSEYYLAASIADAPSTVPDGPPTPRARPTSPHAPLPVETPPPRATG